MVIYSTRSKRRQESCENKQSSIAFSSLAWLTKRGTHMHTQTHTHIHARNWAHDVCGHNLNNTRLSLTAQLNAHLCAHTRALKSNLSENNLRPYSTQNRSCLQYKLSKWIICNNILLGPEKFSPIIGKFSQRTVRGLGMVRGGGERRLVLLI